MTTHTVPDTRAAQAERPSYAPSRLRRAWQLVSTGRVLPMGGTRYRVAGNVQPYYDVDLSANGAAELPCYCLDMEYRSHANKGQCKHVLAAKLAALDPGMLDAIAATMVAQQDQYNARRGKGRAAEAARAQGRIPALGRIPRCANISRHGEQCGLDSFPPHKCSTRIPATARWAQPCEECGGTLDRYADTIKHRETCSHAVVR